MGRVAICCISLLLFAFANCVYAQDSCSITLSGVLLEEHNHQPIYPAVVYVDELSKAIDVDEQGKFTLDDLCHGDYALHFHAAGYMHYQEVYHVEYSKSVKFYISHQDNVLNEVVIGGEQVPTVLQSKEKLDKAAIDANAGKTLGDMLQAVNGVTTINNGATIAKPVIHGLHSNRIVMVNNGVRQEDQQWGGEHAPNIDPFLANNITVVKGAAGVRYGTDALGGVVLVEPAPLPNKPGWEGDVNLVGFSNNRMGVVSGMVAHNTAKVPGLSFRLQGTVKKGGTYRVPGHWVANTGVQETNYSATLGWKRTHVGTEIFYSHFNTDLGIYRGSHTGNQQDLLAAINSDTPQVYSDFTYNTERPRQHVEHDLAKVKFYADTKFGFWTADYAFQHNFRQEYDVLRKDNDKAQLNLTLNTQTFNVNLDHKPIKGFDGDIGFDGVYQQNFIQKGDRVFLPNYLATGIAGYIIEKYKWKSWLLEGGIRFDYKSYDVYNPEGNNQAVVRYNYDYSGLSGTLGLKRQIRKNWDLSITLANGWRVPQANELFSAGFHHGAARIELGNKDLLPERSYNLNIDNKINLGKATADLTLYTQYIKNYIYLEPGNDLLTIQGYYKTFNYKQTNASLSGLDASISYPWSSNLTSIAKASFLFARDVSRNDWVILMPADRLTLQNRYTWSMGNHFKDCYLGVDGRYVFRQWKIPANFDEIDYPRPPADYFLLDAVIGGQIRVGQQPLDVSITASNILNKSYREYLDAFRYFINQPGTNIVLRIHVPLFNNAKKK